MSKLDPILTKMREICLSLPDTKETLTWGQPHFRVGDKIFSGYGEEKGKKVVGFIAPKKLLAKFGRCDSSSPRAEQGDGSQGRQTEERQRQSIVTRQARSATQDTRQAEVNAPRAGALSVTRRRSARSASWANLRCNRKPRQTRGRCSPRR